MHEAALLVGSFTTQQRRSHGVGISLFRADDEGWHLADQISTEANPSYLALHPSLPVFYSAHADIDCVSAFAWDGAAGRIRALGNVLAGGSNGTALAVHPSGAFLVVANFASGTVSSIPLVRGGRLGSDGRVLHLPDSQDAPEVAAPTPQPHDIVFDPSGQFVLVPDRGLGRVHTLSVTDGVLGHLAYASLRPRSGPRHLVFHPRLALAYLVTEIDSTVVVCDWDEGRAHLTPLRRYSTLPDNFFGHSQTAEIRIDPTGRYLYVSNRGMDSISRLSVSPDGRELALAGFTDAGGRTPRQFALAPDGNQIVVANQDTDVLVEFDVRGPAGELYEKAKIPCLSPASVLFARP